MPIIFELARWPRTRRTPEAIRQELRKAYTGIMWPAMHKMLKNLAGTNVWAYPPRFYYKMKISGRRYYFAACVDNRTRGGRHFTWLDKGTGEEGPYNQSYDIFPKTKPQLVFDVPYHPITFPPDGLAYNPSVESETIFTGSVLGHPGTRPRRISERVIKKFKDRRYSKGFYRVTENAYRRGFRKATKSA